MFKACLAALCAGIALRFVVGLEPVWWLAWIAPALLLALALRSDSGRARWLTLLASLIATSANVVYFNTVMPLPAALLVTAGQALSWVVVVMTARRIVLRHQAWWTVFAYPVIWTSADTLMAAFLPDGNWGSIGYSQYEFLPALQLVSLLGVGGVTFVVSLFASALAMALAFGLRTPRTKGACAAAALATIATLAYGVQRLQTPAGGAETVFGLVAIDDAIGLQATAAYSESIWRQYEQHVAKLARQGATVIVLPEKVAVMTPAKALEAQQRFAALAARFKVWIDIGVGIDDKGKRTNLAWLLSPQGSLAQAYQKHHMAPPEREYISGSDYKLQSIAGQPYGLAICKDMHFGALGRAYGERQASVMLVPAWDFHADRFLANGMTTARGVENGYAVVRSSREGLLTVSDPFGRVLAQQESAAMPGSAMLARIKVSARVPTLYTRIGDWPGWLCVAAMLAMLLPGDKGALRKR
jgi:apolipoprotein N-acyltransferase